MIKQGASPLGHNEEIVDSNVNREKLCFSYLPAPLMVLWKDKSVHGMGRAAGQSEMQ